MASLFCMGSCDYVRFLCFFFSSRRRHTRYWRDWSSDVCSSDLPLMIETVLDDPVGVPERRVDVAAAVHDMRERDVGAHVRMRQRRSALQRFHRSEERRVGKECRSRWAPCHEKKKTLTT